MKKYYLKPRVKVRQFSTEYIVLAESDPSKHDEQGSDEHLSKELGFDDRVDDGESAWATEGL